MKKNLVLSGNGRFEKITCFICHMGHVKPMVNVDLLPKKEKQKTSKKDKTTENDTLKYTSKQLLNVYLLIRL